MPEPSRSPAHPYRSFSGNTVADDNGSLFIYTATKIWCETKNLAFSRSRNHKKTTTGS